MQDLSIIAHKTLRNIARMRLPWVKGSATCWAQGGVIRRRAMRYTAERSTPPAQPHLGDSRSPNQASQDPREDLRTP